MADLVPLAAEAYGTRPALLHKAEGEWRPVSYARLGEAVAEVGSGLAELGLRPGARAAILSHSRPEWTFAHFGVLAAGGVSVSVHQGSSDEECRAILEHSEAELIFVEDGAQLEKVRSVRASLPRLRQVVVFDPAAGGADVLSLEEVRGMGRAAGAAELNERIAAVEPASPCLIIYTSGTAPKGCVLLDPDEVARYASVHGLVPESVEESAEIREILRREVDRVNAGVGHGEQIKRFAIMRGGLSAEDVVDSLYGIAPPSR